MIGWYVHHHGSGHVTRAATIAAHLRLPVTGFSTRARPEGWSGGWRQLPDDAGADGPGCADVTAGSTLHWVPRHHDGLRARMAALAASFADGRIRLVVVDVSVEVTVLARLFGVPVVVVAQPGDRTDRAHRTAYDMAERILAPWPALPSRPWPSGWAAKTEYLGGISRYDRATPSVPAGSEPTVLVVWGRGGLDVPWQAVVEAATATPEWSWLVAGPPPSRRAGGDPPNLRDLGWVPDLWPLLCAANVVVTHAGQNAVAEVAAARRPAVIVPQGRPFSEQTATADALERASIAAVARSWPPPPAWRSVLASAVRLGGGGWSRWSSGHGAADAARCIEAIHGPQAP
jgi:hypothetical protein